MTNTVVHIATAYIAITQRYVVRALRWQIYGQVYKFQQPHVCRVNGMREEL